MAGGTRSGEKEKTCHMIGIPRRGTVVPSSGCVPACRIARLHVVLSSPRRSTFKRLRASLSHRGLRARAGSLPQVCKSCSPADGPARFP